MSDQDKLLEAIDEKAENISRLLADQYGGNLGEVANQLAELASAVSLLARTVREHMKEQTTWGR